MTARQKLEDISSRFRDAKTAATINLIVERKFYQFLEDNSISVDVSDGIVRSQNADAIKALLQTNQVLSEFSQRKIWEEGTRDVVMLLLTRRQPLTEKLEEKLLLQKNNDLVSIYIDHHAFRENTEQLFIRSKSYLLIEKYIKKHKFSLKSQMDLIKFPQLLLTYLKSYNLSVEALKEFVVKYHYPEVMEALVNKAHGCDSEYILCRYADELYLDKYIQNNKIERLEAILHVLLERGLDRLVVLLLERNQSKKFNIRLEEKMLSSSTEVLQTYIENFDLGREMQQGIIERNYSSEIERMIKSNFVHPDVQIQILNRGITREIILLLINHQTSKDFQLGVLKRGLSNEIVAMCSSNILFTEVQEKLIERGVDSEITCYLDRKSLDNSAFSKLISLKGELVSYYISRNILNDYQLKDFTARATDSDIEIYISLYYPNED